MTDTAGAVASVRYRASDEVDFVVGAGASGGVVARQLSTAGYHVVVLEQVPYLRETNFCHDELSVVALAALTNDFRQSPNTFRTKATDAAAVRPVVQYGRVVGGGLVHFTGNWLAPARDRLRGALAEGRNRGRRSRRLADHLRGSRAVLYACRLGDRRLRARRIQSVRTAAQ